MSTKKPFLCASVFCLLSGEAVACDCTPIEARLAIETNGDVAAAFALHGNWKSTNMSSGFPLNWRYEDDQLMFGYEAAYLVLWYAAWVVAAQLLYPDGPGSGEKGQDVLTTILIVPFVLSNFQINQTMFGTRMYMGMEHQLSHFGAKTLVEKLGVGVGYRIWKYYKLSAHVVANIDDQGVSPSCKLGIKVGEYAK